MGLTRSSVRRAITGLATAGLLTGVLLTAPSAAQAAPAETAALLSAATADLDATARVPGTAWAVNNGKVEITVDETVTGAKLQHLLAVTAKHGKAVSIVSTPGTLTPFITGGDAILTGGSRCSLGFNVRNAAGQRFFLTAGHCTNAGATWRTSGGQTIGTRFDSRFPGDDYGIVRITNAAVSSPSRVGGQTITRLANPTVGQRVNRRGSTTGTHSGRVTGLNATVNYQQGSVFGMIRTTVCAQPGDSGGSLYAGSTGLGLTSGGSGNCTTGGVTFFQPVVEAADRYRVRI